MRALRAPSASKLLLVTVLVASFLGAAAESRAVPTTVPTGLDPGDFYRLAFRTLYGDWGVPTDIAFYNGVVTDRANAVPELLALGATWTAIASTATVDARDNTSTNPFVDGAGVPIYLLDGTLLATGNADLWDGSIQTPLAVDENGNQLPPSGAFTGTLPDGTGAPGNTLGVVTPFYGDTSATDGRWIQDAVLSYSFNAPYYAISSTLVVVPEPGTYGLLGMKLVAMGLRRRNAEKQRPF